ENGVYQQTFNCLPTTCPALTFPNVIWTPPGAAIGAPFAGAVASQVTTFAPPALTQASRGQAPDWVTPRVHEGDVAVERELPGGIGGSVAYVVGRGWHLPVCGDANLAPATAKASYDILSTSGQTSQTVTVPYYTGRIDTNTGIINAGYSDINSWYNSMVIAFRRPMRHGLEFTANYTLSHAFDGGQPAGNYGTFAGTILSVDPKNRTPECAGRDLDQRHRFVATAVWAQTIRGLSNKPAKLALNGWVLSTIVTMSSGQTAQANITGTPSPLDGGMTAGDANNASPTAGRAAPPGRTPSPPPWLP